MKCFCGVNSFTYQTLEKENDKYNRVLICNCGIFITDGKKKAKCDFYNKIILKSGISIEYDSKIETVYNKYYVNNLKFDERCRKDINWNIHLIKIALNYPDNINISNYISVINYNLRNLEYKPFFPNKESIKNLEYRLSNKPDDVRVHFITYKSKKKTKRDKPVSKNKNFIPLVENYTYDKEDDEDDDEYSDVSDEKCDTFDVEFYESPDEIEDVLEEEAFSD